MKFNQICRIGAASVLSLAACLGLTACSRDYTVGFLYVTSSRGSTSAANGVLNEYGIDYQTGSLIRLASSGQDTGGRNPVALTVTANQKDVIVVNRDDSNLVVFAIGTDGKLYAKTTTTVAGSFPTAIALSGDNNFLYVAFTYKPGFTTANPGPGGVEVFPLTYDAEGTVTLGTPVANGSLNYFPLGYNPTGLAVTSNVNNTTTTSVNGTCSDTTCSSYVYAIGQDPKHGHHEQPVGVQADDQHWCHYPHRQHGDRYRHGVLDGLQLGYSGQRHHGCPAWQLPLRRRSFRQPDHRVQHGRRRYPNGYHHWTVRHAVAALCPHD